MLRHTIGWRLIPGIMQILSIPVGNRKKLLKWKRLWPRHTWQVPRHTWDQPFDKNSPPIRELANTVCTTCSWVRSMCPSCFTSSAQSGMEHSSQSSIVNHCLPLKTLRETFMQVCASSISIALLSSTERCWSCRVAWDSNQSKYLMKLWNFTFWCGLRNERNRNRFERKQIVRQIPATYSCKLRKKNVKLKSCNVGCVFSVRLGNVEKNAFANNAATKS